MYSAVRAYKESLRVCVSQGTRDKYAIAAANFGTALTMHTYWKACNTFGEFGEPAHLCKTQQGAFVHEPIPAKGLFRILEPVQQPIWSHHISEQGRCRLGVLLCRNSPQEEMAAKTAIAHTTMSAACTSFRSRTPSVAGALTYSPRLRCISELTALRAVNALGSNCSWPRYRTFLRHSLLSLGHLAYPHFIKQIAPRISTRRQGKGIEVALCRNLGGTKVFAATAVFIHRSSACTIGYNCIPQS